MNNKIPHLEEVEEKVNEKVKRRENKKRKRMPISGKSVFTLQKIKDKKLS